VQQSHPLDEAEALLDEHAFVFRRLSPTNLPVEDLVLDISGTLRLAGTAARLPNAGAHELLRLVRQREALRRRYGAARLPSEVVWETSPERRALERRFERASEARQRAEQKRDEALAMLRKAKKRLRAKSAECEDLLLELREG